MKIIDRETVLTIILMVVLLLGWKSALAHHGNGYYNGNDIIQSRNAWVFNVCVGDAACIAANYKDDAVIVIDRNAGNYTVQTPVTRD